jgi:hypothetical protein
VSWEDHLKKKNFQKRIFLTWTCVFAGALLLLPLDAVLDEGGGVAPWFVLYLASGASLILMIGFLIKTQKSPSWRGGVEYLPDGGFVEEELKGLDDEDRELLQSLVELREWYIQSLALVRYNRKFADVLERWYRLSIAKELEVRDLKRTIRQSGLIAEPKVKSQD